MLYRILTALGFLSQSPGGAPATPVVNEAWKKTRVLQKTVSRTGLAPIEDRSPHAAWLAEHGERLHHVAYFVPSFAAVAEPLLMTGEYSWLFGPDQKIRLRAAIWRARREGFCANSANAPQGSSAFTGRCIDTLRPVPDRSGDVGRSQDHRQKQSVTGAGRGMSDVVPKKRGASFG